MPNLAWQPCDDGFFCATATVPLDYANPTGATIRLAVIKRPATDPAHRIGSVFFNPGGPGGAGTSELPLLYGQFPPAVRARFDLVSWDSRGVGQSDPVQCFDSAARRVRPPRSVELDDLFRRVAAYRNRLILATQLVSRQADRITVQIGQQHGCRCAKFTLRVAVREHCADERGRVMAEFGERQARSF